MLPGSPFDSLELASEVFILIHEAVESILQLFQCSLVVSVAGDSLGISSLFGLVKFSAALGLKLVDLSNKLLLFESDTFLFNFQVFKALSVVPSCLSKLLLSSLQLCGLKLKLLID